jgi:cysteine desulfurase / selenocysteine lyase
MTEELSYLRKDFEILKKKIIYFDNAATTLKPNQVINKINEYYYQYPANIHRGNHQLSMKASIEYEKAHEITAKFVNAAPSEIVFTLNSTDAINQVMYSLYNSNYFKKNDEIIITIMEHHANLVPWQYLSQKLGLVLKFVIINKDYTFNIEDYKKKLTNKTKLVAVTHVSNTTGIITPIKEITKLAKQKKSLVLIDGSQAVPHMKINFKNIGCDFYVFTSHKMLGPTGVGVLVGSKKILSKLEPFRFGGDMISDVNLKRSLWNKLPLKYEAGTPNVAGVVGFSESIRYLEDVGFKKIQKNDQELLKYCLEKIKKINNIKIYNNQDPKKQAPIVLFDLKNNGCKEVSSFLDVCSKIATRAGVHCAQPFVNSLNKKGLVRASFYLYNTFEEIDIFIKTLKKLT